jgi:hypothetical protein
MTASPSSNSRLIFGSLVFALAAVCLLINLLGVARLAYDVVVNGLLAGVLAKAIILTLVFVFGLGLGMASQRRFATPAFSQFARVYAWAYLTLVCATYLIITFQVSDHNYSVAQYGGYLAMLALELLTVLGLLLIVPGRVVGMFAIPLMAIVIFHLGLIVYLYIFLSAPLSPYLLGDILLLVLMASISSALLGESAFRAVIERFIEKVG